MSLSAKLRRTPLRMVTGAFILNSGIGKLRADEKAAEGPHGMAANAYPALEKVPPKPFIKTLAVGETVLGAALLLPVVPAGLAGLGLIGFSGALLGMWWRTPGMHEPDSPRPTKQGVPIAKDVWMLGIGASLVADWVLEPAHTKRVELTTDAKVGTARRTARMSSAAKLARARTETKVAKATRKAAARAGAARSAIEAVTP